MLWARIQGSIAKFANTISKTLDVDVMIVDSNLKVIGTTFRYFDQYEIIRRVSVIGQAITNREVIAIENRRKFKTCQACPEYETCVMRGLIAVPIFYHDTVVGAIALILPQQRVGPIFKDVDNSIEFLQNMAALLSSKLQDSDDYSALDIIKQEREILMDEVEYAIVSTDNLGGITYHNSRFSEYFRPDKSCVGEMLYDIIPHRVISDFLSHQVKAVNELIFIETGSESFYGLVTCKNITIKGWDNGALFLFKPVHQINSDFSEISGPNAQVSFPRYEGQLFPLALTDDAKRLAVGGKIVLIEYAPHTDDLLLAQCIHNYSDRSRAAMVTVDCDSVRDIQEKATFGELGQLHLAHKGTVFFRNIDLLPYYLQEKLVEFIKDRTLSHGSEGAARVDVHLLFSTTADLKAMVAQGAFLEPLYYRISEYVLRIPPIAEDPVQLRALIESSLRFCRTCYRKNNLTISPEAMERLCSYGWPGNLTELNQTLDRLVRCADGRVDLDKLRACCPTLFAGWQQQSMVELERERIRTLLQNRCPKEEISHILGISRATLYRKIKQYRLG